MVPWLRSCFVILTTLLMGGGCSAELSGDEDQGPLDPTAPRVRFISPEALVSVEAGEVVRIEYVDDDTDSEARTDLFADKDGDIETTEDQFIIAEGLPESDGAPQVVQWDTFAAPLGAHHVLAVSRDEKSETVARAAGRVEVSGDPIAFENFAQSKEVLRYDLALVRGVVRVKAEQATVSAGTTASVWPVERGRFKALVPLQRGLNTLDVTAGSESLQLELTYAPQTNPHRLRFIYLIPSDDEGTFQAPSGAPSSVDVATARIGLGAQLLQTFAAEKMYEQGLGRRTFRLQRDGEGRPLVLVLRTSRTSDEWRALDTTETRGQLRDALLRELRVLPRRDVTDVAFTAFSRYDSTTGEGRWHSVLSGGTLAIFRTTSLYAWASSIEEAIERWEDGSRLPAGFADDSAGRGTVSSAYATTLGATLHGIGHCFGLRHTADSSGIMGRGFDDFHRVFAVREPGEEKLLATWPRSAEPSWHRSSAMRMAFHRYLDLEARSYSTHRAPEISVGATDVVVTSVVGIGHVAYEFDAVYDGRSDDRVHDHEEFLDAASAPTRFSVARSAVQEIHPDARRARLTAVDVEGNVAAGDWFPIAE